MAAGEERRKHALILSRVNRLRRRLNSQLWLERVAVPVWCAATATAAWRLFIHRGTAWAAVGSALCGGAWWFARARRQRVSTAEAAVRADRLVAAGGLLLTRLELSVGEWELTLNERMRDLVLPPLRPGRAGLSTLAALAFLAAALAVPLPARVESPLNSAAAGKLAEVEAKAEALAKEMPLDPNAEAELERLQREAEENRFDARDWEAADGLEAGLDRKAAEAAAQLSGAEQAAKSLEDALAGAQGHDDAARERDELERALSSLSAPAGDNGESRADNAGDGGTRPGEQKAVAQASEAQKAGAEKRGAEKPGKPSSSQAQRMSATQAGELKKALERRREALGKTFHGEGRPSPGDTGGAPQNGTELAQGDWSSEGDPDGEGAPVHGPGKGHLRFGPMPELHPERLEFAPLPEGHGGDANELWGLSAADPSVKAGSARPRPGAGIAAGEQTPGHRQAVLLPRNRELTRRYFGGP